ALEERVEAHTAPAHVELRPLGDAADIDRPVARSERLERRPVPADGLADETLDRERPAIERDARRGTRGENGKVARQVLARRDAAGRTCFRRRPAADEAACHEPLCHLAATLSVIAPRRPRLRSHRAPCPSAWIRRSRGGGGRAARAASRRAPSSPSGGSRPA